MLKLYHGYLSVCAQKARLALAEKGLEWKSQIVNLQRGEQQTPDYLKLNPKGVIPTLIHDGQVIRESNDGWSSKAHVENNLKHGSMAWKTVKAMFDDAA